MTPESAMRSYYEAIDLHDRLSGRPEDPLDAYRRQAATAPSVRKTYSLTEARAAAVRDDDAWNKWVDARVKCALDAQWDFFVQVYGQAIAEERKLMRQYVDEQVGLLRADTHLQNSIARGEIAAFKFKANDKRDTA